MMKTNKSYILLLGALALATSCAKEVAQTEPSAPVTLTAVIADETKATLDESDGKFSFTTGDAIKVFNGNDVYASKGITVYEDGSATFTMADGFTDSGAGFAAYPASSVSDITAAGVTFTLPTTYTYEQVSGINVPCPMMASYTAGQNMVFKQAGSVIRFRIKNCLEGSLIFTFKTQVTGAVTLATVPSGDNGGILPDNFAQSSTYGGYSIEVTNVPAVTGDNYIYVTLPVPVSTDPKNVCVWSKGASSELYKYLTGEPVSLKRAEGYKRGVTLQEMQTTDATFGGLRIAGFLEYRGEGSLSEIANYHIQQDPLVLVQHYNQITSDYQCYFSWTEITQSIPDLFTSRGIKIGDYYYDVPTGGAYGQWKTIAAEDRPVATLNFGDNSSTTAHYAFVTITGLTISTTPARSTVRGLLLFPDGHSITVPDGTTLKYLDAASKTNDKNVENIVTPEALTSLRAQGCVFLPAAGCYDKTNSKWWDIDTGGYYWSRTNYNRNEAYALAFTDKKSDGTQDGKFTISPINSVDNKTNACFPILLIQL